MPGRPNIQSAELNAAGDKLVVLGQSDNDPLPQEILIYLEQGGALSRGVMTLAGGGVHGAWSVEMDGTGFARGDVANGVGLEIRTGHFEATAWTQVLTIT